jgi:CDP-diacylglycerol--glycerol-3-phosphate 3-phosphatidyltransferase
VNIPNALTIVRFALIPAIIVLLYSKDPRLVLLSTGVFLVAAFTDWLDGTIARKYKLITRFGTFFDPLADKLLILSMFFVLVDLEIIPLWVVLLILARELVVTDIRNACSTNKKVVGANWMGKTKFILQTLLILYLQLVLYVQRANMPSAIFTIPIAYYATVGVTVVSLLFAINFAYWHRKELFAGL